MFLAVIFLIQACELHIWRIYSVVCCLLLHSQWLISLPLCNWFWIYFHVHIIWGNPRDFCWRCFCPKRTLGRELRASPLGTLYLPTHHSFLSPRLALPPSPILQNEFHWKKLRTWGEGEVSCFIDQISPSVFSGYSGFSKTLMDLVLRWLCILAKTWWVNYCFPKKATLSRRAWKNGGKSHMYGETFFMCDDVLTGWFTNYVFSRNVPQRGQYPVESLNSFNVDLK